MKKYIAEGYGTFVLVLLGCATAMIGVRYFGNLGIAMAFGISVMAMYYTIGGISGAHINPAITIAAAASGRIKWIDSWKYIPAQLIGATLASLLLFMIAIGVVNGSEFVSFLGQNGVKNGYTIPIAFVAEFMMTYIFAKLYLSATAPKGHTEVAGIVLGLTYMMLHFVLMPVTGASLNPARSFGPAVFLGGEHLQQLWLFVLAPSLGGLVAGSCHKWFEKMK